MPKTSLKKTVKPRRNLVSKQSRKKGKKRTSMRSPLLLWRRARFNPLTLTIIVVGVLALGYLVVKSFAATPYCTLSITGSGTPSNSNQYTATWHNYNYFGAQLTAKLVHTYNGNVKNLAFSASGSTPVVPASATEKGYRYEVYNGGSSPAYSCTPNSVPPPPPPPPSNSTYCTLTISGSPTAGYKANWVNTNVWVTNNPSARLANTYTGSAPAVLAYSAAGSHPISPAPGATNGYRYTVWNAGAATSVTCTATVTVPATGGGGGGGSGGGSGGGGSGGGSGGGDSGGGVGERSSAGDDGGGEEAPREDASNQAADDGFESSGWDWQPDAAGVESDFGSFEGLPEFDEIDIEDIFGKSDEEIQDLIDETLNLNSDGTSKSSSGGPAGETILRSYSGKLKLFPPEEALANGATEIRYYVNNRLKKTVKKAPYNYTLDTTRHKNGRYILRIVPYQGKEKLHEYKYILSIKNNLTFWQQAYNFFTSPFVR